MRVIGLAALVVMVFAIACGEPERTTPPTAAPLPTYTPYPTQTPLPTETRTATPRSTSTAEPTPTPTLTATLTSSPWPTPSATPTITPTPTAIPTFSPPEHMTYTWWSWGPLDKTGYRELEVEFTIHNNPEPFPEDNPFNGLYMMLGWGKLAGHSFYFGIQSNMTSPVPPYGGFNHGVLFSRWDTRDLALARWHETEGWSQSSGLEGDFIGVRRLYDWGAGDYRLRLAPEETTDEGEWYGLWITDLEDDETTWIGSLAFPAESAIYGNGYSTMEVYGEPVHPEDIPYWHVSTKLPKADGQEPEMVYLGYSQFTDQVSNSDIQYDADERRVHMKAGGPTERIGQARDVYFN